MIRREERARKDKLMLYLKTGSLFACAAFAAVSASLLSLPARAHEAALEIVQLLTAQGSTWRNGAG
jgi:hypothetical protein